uniref:Odorant-binding protein 6 n=1 Tax=Encarsia formosa TaxID=32400 RepID=A0A514TTW6_ENCFO|nr:odorant-binding protein 6 [Encarsia formosa]
MKSFIFVTVLIIFAMQYELVMCGEKLDIAGLKNMLKPMSKTCKGKTGATDEMIQATHAGEFSRERSLMCYFKCLSVMLKGMNKQGEATPEAARRQVEIMVREDVAVKLLALGDKCHAKVPPENYNDVCLYALEYVECCYFEDKSLYFLP